MWHCARHGGAADALVSGTRGASPWARLRVLRELEREAHAAGRRHSYQRAEHLQRRFQEVAAEDQGETLGLHRAKTGQDWGGLHVVELNELFRADVRRVLELRRRHLDRLENSFRKLDQQQEMHGKALLAKRTLHALRNLERQAQLAGAFDAAEHARNVAAHLAAKGGDYERAAAAEPAAADHGPRAVRAVVVRAFDAANDGDLALTAGETVVVTHRDPSSGWWSGVDRRGASGVFPAAFVELVEEEEAREAAEAAPGGRHHTMVQRRFRSAARRARALVVSVDGEDEDDLEGGAGAGDNGGRGSSRLSVDALANLLTSGSLERRGRRDTRHTRRVDLALALQGSATAADVSGGGGGGRGRNRQRASLRRSDSIRSVPEVLLRHSGPPREHRGGGGRRASVASASPAHGPRGLTLAAGPWSAEAVADKARTEEEDTVAALPRTRSKRGMHHTASQHADHVLKMQSRRRRQNQESRRRKKGGKHSSDQTLKKKKSRRHNKGHHKTKLGKKKKTHANLKGKKGKRQSKRDHPRPSRSRRRRKVSAAEGATSQARLLALMDVAKQAQRRDEEAAAQAEAAANDDKDEERSAFKVRPSLKKILAHNKSESARRSRGSVTRHSSAPLSDARPTMNVKRRETVTSRRRSLGSSSMAVGAGDGGSLLPRSFTFRRDDGGGGGDDDQGQQPAAAAPPPARATQAQRRKRGTIAPTPSTGSVVSLGAAAAAAAVQRQKQRRASLASAAPHLLPQST